MESKLPPPSVLAAAEAAADAQGIHDYEDGHTFAHEERTNYLYGWFDCYAHLLTKAPEFVKYSGRGEHSVNALEDKIEKLIEANVQMAAQVQALRNELELSTARWMQAKADKAWFEVKRVSNLCEARRKEIERLKAELAEAKYMIEHALELECFTLGGSTEGWAKKILERK